eukprot:c53974_g1_i1 orf=20-307(+)
MYFKLQCFPGACLPPSLPRAVRIVALSRLAHTERESRAKFGGFQSMNPHRGKGRASSGSHTGPGSDYEGSSGSAASWQAGFRGRGGREGDGRGGI